MNLLSWLRRPLRGSPSGRSIPGATTPPTPALLDPQAMGRPAELRLAPGADGLRATASPMTPQGQRRMRRSWFGWLFGRNRRRDGAGRLVQGEFLLTQVRPVRNDFRDADDDGGRSRAKLLYETPPSPERRDDQDHAWNRLRNRRPGSMVVSGD
ncbi:MAG: hypothetical protein J0L84_15600 [Verrucomicrobia bacterium]|nr:hypothetical protein [Verrucomicrobiota bacterium]